MLESCLLLLDPAAGAFRNKEQEEGYRAGLKVYSAAEHRLLHLKHRAPLPGARSRSGRTGPGEETYPRSADGCVVHWVPPLAAQRHRLLHGPTFFHRVQLRCAAIQERDPGSRRVGHQEHERELGGGGRSDVSNLVDAVPAAAAAAVSCKPGD